MTLLDAYALIAFVGAEPAAAEVEALMREGDASVVVTNLAETVDVLQRVYAIPRTDIETYLRPLVGGPLELRSLDADDAWRAADIRSRYSVRGSSELSLADCLLISAADMGDSVATADVPLARAARAEGLAVVALPDRAGRRP